MLKNDVVYSVLKNNDTDLVFEHLQMLYPNQDKNSILFNINRAPINSIYAAYFNQKIIGTAWCLPLKFGIHCVGGIGGVGVNKLFQNKKIGLNLLSYLLSKESLNYDSFLLWTRVPGFFEKLGFKDFSNGIITETGDSIPMLKTQNPALLNDYPKPMWERIKF